MLLILAYIATLLIGISLGVIGGGGSILTLPVLAYLFHIEPILATTYSLFIVGITSVVGSISYFKSGWVNIKTAILFGIPSVIAVFVTRAYLLPALPENFNLIHLTINKNTFLMLLFAMLMLMAAYSFIKNSKCENVPDKKNDKSNYLLIFAEGILIGVFTGLVGAGGGFLLIPALVFWGKLPMKEAIGTSLVIIAVKSLIGFSAESNLAAINWINLASITFFAIIGIFIGFQISKKLNAEKLKPIFGWMVLVMALFIILKELNAYGN